MFFIRKLKPPGFNYETVVGIACGATTLFLLVFFSLYVAFGFMALFLLVYSVIISIIYLRSLNTGFLVLTITIFFDSVFCATVAAQPFGLPEDVTRVFAFIIIILTVILLIFLFNRKLKWRYREILELAALPVKETSSGYTNRPIPAGGLEYTKAELYAFSRFLHSQLIAIPYFESEGVVFCISAPLSKQLGLNRDLSESTIVTFGLNGTVSARISEFDYQKYVDHFAFDQLSNQLGSVFIQFFEWFEKGEGNKIIEKLNSLRLSPITE